MRLAPAGLGLYPSLPIFTHPWTAESPQFPPSAARRDSEEPVQELPRAPANGAATWVVDIRAWSTAEGAMEERGEEVLGLTQRLPLHRTQALHSLNQGRELLL